MIGLKILTSIGLAGVFVGCASFDSGSFRARSSGDSNQESLACKGDCTISTTMDPETGALTGWSLATTGDGEGVWHTGESANDPEKIINATAAALGTVAEKAAAGARPGL